MKAKKAFDSHTTKIVIAEDELLVRVGLKSIIPWEKYNLELVSEFFNGDELLQYIRKYPPHILLLDIKLPLDLIFLKSFTMKIYLSKLL